MLIKLAETHLLGILSYCRQIFLSRRVRSLSLLFATGLGLSLVVAACSPTATTQDTATANTSAPTKSVTVSIGYQKSATVLNALKTKGDLEKALATSKSSVKFVEFPAGPPLLEGMNAGSIDFGYTGEAPPVFAQAAGTPLVYVAYETANPKSEGIVVPKDSPIKTLADLKGKKVAFAKGSNTNYLIVKALEKAGLQYSDITPVFLKPADARAAFEGGNVDAWAIWDPYLAAAEKTAGARLITDATDIAANRGYYLARKGFVDEHPEILKLILDEVKKVDRWAAGNPVEVAKFLETQLGIEASVLEVSEKRRNYGVSPLTDEEIAGQQEIADTFHKLELIPKPVQVKQIVLKDSK
ncbi:MULTISPECIES: sulfonate ABC transporter substrate-binding protein [unclassified Microcoleus]|uniref:sulfonate ABC transporter substrate-binding protein n=1 Tax=unclassified Microcoleus TaxID=2642155 RepID=UPI002FCFB72A